MPEVNELMNDILGKRNNNSMTQEDMGDSRLAQLGFNKRINMGIDDSDDEMVAAKLA